MKFKGRYGWERGYYYYNSVVPQTTYSLRLFQMKIQKLFPEMNSGE